MKDLSLLLVVFESDRSSVSAAGQAVWSKYLSWKRRGHSRKSCREFWLKTKSGIINFPSGRVSYS